MNKFYCVLALWLLTFNCQVYAQLNNSTKTSNIINQAEIAIVKGYENKAFKLYQSIPIVELKLNDLNNFFLLAINKKNVKLSLKICKEIAQRGVGRNYFSKSIFESLSNNKEFENIVNNAEKFRNKLVEKAKFHSKIIDSVYKVDQIIAKNRTQKYSGGEIPATILDSFDTNTKYLIKFVKQHGFPVEGNIAPDIYQDSIYYFKMDYLFIFIHCLQMSIDDALKSECKNIIINAIHKGVIPRSHLFFIQEFGYLVLSESLGEQYFAYDPFSKKLWKSNYLTADEILKINKTRMLYNFPTIEDEIRKYIYIAQNGNFNFEGNIKTIVVEYMNENERINFLDSYHEISK